MNNLSPQRRKVVILAATVTSMSSFAILLKPHFLLRLLWVALILAGLVVVGVQFAKLRRQEP